MQVLIDSHTLLWAILEHDRLSTIARSTWLDEANDLLVSPASLWEIAIKIGLGKLVVDGSLEEFYASEIAANKLAVLPVLPRHAARVATLPYHHRDPFDRMLVAQALCEDLPLLSADSQLDAYGVQRIW